jgi:hypothetical protein
MGRLGMPHGDDEAGSGEDVHLAELDLLAGVDVVCGAEHDEHGIAVAVELGSLVPGEGVFDGERMEPELVGDVAQFRLVRAVEPDPRHAVPRAHLLERLIERRGVGRAEPIHVDGVVDDGHSGPPPPLYGRLSG